MDHFWTTLDPFILFPKTTLPWPCSWRRARRPGPHPRPWKWVRQPNKVSWCQQLISTGILSFVMSNSSRYVSNQKPKAKFFQEAIFFVITFAYLKQRVLNRWSKLSEQKLRFFFKSENLKKMLLIKNDGLIGFI